MNIEQKLKEPMDTWAKMWELDDWMIGKYGFEKERGISHLHGDKQCCNPKLNHPEKQKKNTNRNGYTYCDCNDESAKLGGIPFGLPRCQNRCGKKGCKVC